ncbi:hypothetical protein NC653_026004 [Populus alba x Populus x berolinensis]|uniref:RCC1-like domain-containing protein n=1 Tax=Populus alba x Populus x berolinensis TaxID=444605 RepID=A0AAD6MCX5_9ROSI|nr:hypothetical protein NC653_026004 [Populus alba x Populus x berolinensis]
MNGEGKEEAVKMEVNNERLVFMWGYLPGALPQRSPISSPLAVRSTVYAWKDETPEAFPLPTEASIVKAAAGWAHCVAATAQTLEKSIHGDGKNVFPQGKSLEIHQGWEDQQRMLSPRSQGSRSSSGSGNLSGVDGRGSGDESTKRRRISSAKQAAESSSAGDETLSALPCLVTLNPGVRVATVAAGGRHTLALSDIGQVWGWGYGGEGQLGLGSRIRMVSSPHPIPCIDSAYGKDRAVVLSRGGMTSEGQSFRVPGSHVKGIACGGRHSAVITDAGALLTFGWGLYGQCGQGSTDDELSPTCVSSLLGIRIEAVAAGLWHTVCVSADGDVYSFGGNQFGQLGTGGDQAETLPRLLEAPSLENIHAKTVSCGARHSAIITEDGKVFCWGWNKYGQLGLGDVIDRNIPSQVTIDGCVPKTVACGWWHTLLLAESPT